MKPIRTSLAILGRFRPWRWVGLVLLALVASGMEIVGALLVLGVVTFIAAPEQITSLPAATYLPDAWLESPTDHLVTVTAVVAVFFLVRGIVFLTQSYLQARVCHDTGASISARLLEGYLKAPYQVHLRRNSSELIRNAQDAVALFVMNVLVPGISFAADLLLVLGIVGVLLIVDVQATLMAVAVLGVSMAVLTFTLQPWLSRLGARAQELQGRSIRGLQESLHGFRAIRALGRAEPFIEDFRQTRDGLAAAFSTQVTLAQVPRVALELLLLVFVLVYLVAASLTAGSVQETLPVLGLFAYAALRIMPALSRLVSSVNGMRFGEAALDVISRDLAAADAFDEPPAHEEPLPFRQELAAESLTFRYDGAESDAVHDVSFTLERGRWLGIVGPTGGGKSTLVDLMIGLLPPTSGRVTADGVPIHDRTAAWLSSVGVVPQHPFLLDNTVRRNVALGMGDEEIEDENVWDALELAHLADFVRTLPDGLDSVVGEHGSHLSGGQQQRIVIARALYRDPAVLFFDEGTSALDNLTEAALMGTLSDLRGARTLVTVAHRLSSLRACDEILVLEGGRLTDRGTYDELSERNESFRVAL